MNGGGQSGFQLKQQIKKRRINKLNKFGLEIRLPVLARENQQRSFISDAETSKEVFIKYHLMPSHIHII